MRTFRPVNTGWTAGKSSEEALEDNLRGGFNPGNEAHVLHARRLADHLMRGGWGPSHVVNANRNEIVRNMRQAGLADTTIASYGEDIWRTAASIVRRSEETPATVRPDVSTEESTEFKNTYY